MNHFIYVSIHLAQSTNWGHSPDRIGIQKCWFLRRRENRTTRRKTSRSKDKNQQQTQPTYNAESGNRTRATLHSGRRVLSPLRHSSSPDQVPGRLRKNGF